MEYLKPYMAWAGEPQDGAALVFARNAREAKALAWAHVGWLDCDYVDLRVRRQRNGVPYLMSMQKYADKWGVADDLPVCNVCETWGGVPNADGNGCTNCGDGVPPNAYYTAIPQPNPYASVKSYGGECAG